MRVSKISVFLSFGVLFRIMNAMLYSRKSKISDLLLFQICQVMGVEGQKQKSDLEPGRFKIIIKGKKGIIER